MLNTGPPSVCRSLLRQGGELLLRTVACEYCPGGAGGRLFVPPLVDRNAIDTESRMLQEMSAGVGLRDETDPVIAAMVLDRLRNMTPGERADMVRAMNESCETLALAGIRQRHPDADPEEIRMRLGVLRIGPQLMRDAFGWDVDTHGY